MQSSLPYHPIKTPFNATSHFYQPPQTPKVRKRIPANCAFSCYPPTTPTIQAQERLVVPSAQPSNAFVLITGLDAPTGICYDRRSRFLYVVDAGLRSNSQGRILQFAIDTDLKDRFILAEDEVATIYEGPRPFDCWVDAYGNLYFVDSQSQSINIVSFLDLWSGFANKQVTLYRRTSANPQISVPVSLQLRK